MKHLEKVKNPSFWENVRNNPKYQPIIDWNLEVYSLSKMDQFPCIKFTDRFRFYKDGNRDAMETPYYRIRNYLSSCAILALIYPEKEYVNELNDIIWAICDEYSWATSAHTKGDLENDIDFIDLFSSQTGMTLSEVLYLLGDKLEKEVVYRVKYEINKRIITPYQNKKFWWESVNINWAAVCACCVFANFIFMDKEKTDEMLPKILKTMDGYLSGFAEDGLCVEGYSYWQFGFGYFSYFADMLRCYTNGEIDYFKDEKVKKIAAFGQANFLKGDSTLSIGDSSRSDRMFLSIRALLNNVYPDIVPAPESACDCKNNHHSAFLEQIRCFMYFNPDLDGEDYEARDYFFDKSDLLIINKDKYSFTIKGGTNGFSHSHNDVGSIIFCDEDGQAICDLGAGRYTKQYFTDGIRYTIFCNNSLSHTVPIVNGNQQLTSPKCRAALEYNDDIAMVELSRMYPDNPKIIRKTEIKENGVILTDSFEKGVKITERFVSLREPKFEEGAVILGKTKILHDKKFVPVVSTQVHDEHKRAKGLTIAYCIDFDVDVNDTSFSVEIKVQ